MKIKNFRELENIDKKDFTQEEITKLISMGVIKKNDIDFNNFCFRYVGIICLSKTLLIIYPKYLKEYDKNKFKQILLVINKYKKNKKETSLFDDTDKELVDYDTLLIALDLIGIYFEHGIYTEECENIELNGQGDIYWDKTINEQSPIISDNIPIYFEIYTKKNMSNNNNICAILNEIIISNCSEEFKDILSILDIEPIFITTQKISDIGNIEYLINELKKELSNQFITWKQTVLENMIIYLKKIEFDKSFNNIKFMGTTNFNLVWEEVCRVVLNDVSNSYIINDTEIIKCIPKPKWNGIDSEKTLIPDVLVVEKDILHIYDAKYYDLSKTKPGIEDISKQFLYEKAFEKYFKKITNTFLMPLDEEEDREYGDITFDLFKNKKITVIQKSAQKIYDEYLK